MLLVIFLVALIAAILIYFLFVEEQAKRLAQLEQQVIIVQVVLVHSNLFLNFNI